jgi:large subunit ribosomal protein L17
VAEKLVTLARKDTLHARRTAVAFLRQKSPVKQLFEQVVPAAAGRQGGYTRITKLGFRRSDAAPMAIIQWVDLPGAPSSEQTEEAA